jgi:hypothetical protein
MNSDESITTGQAQEALGLGSLASARVQLNRWGIRAVGRDLATGQKRWPVRKIIEAAGARIVAGRPVHHVIAELVHGTADPGDRP